MDISKRNRTELKSYFVTNAIPTESNFADLIDGMLNQKEDGIARPPGNPLCIEAVGDATSTRNVLQLYEGFADSAPEWTLSHRGRAGGTLKRGLSVADATGTCRLFIDRTTGNVGVGTAAPAARLHVAGDLRVDGALDVKSLTVDGKPVGGAADQSGLAIPAGQPVSGVRVIDFKEVKFSRANVTGAYPSFSSAVAFAAPVVSAVVLLKSWNMRFSSGLVLDNRIHEIQVIPDCTFSGNSVTVTVKGGFRKYQGQYADPIAVEVAVVVLAHLQNAI